MQTTVHYGPKPPSLEYSLKHPVEHIQKPKLAPSALQVHYASAIQLRDHFVAEQQQVVRRKGGSCSLGKVTFYLCKIHFRTHNHTIIIQG